jgi:hypothetical protein
VNVSVRQRTVRRAPILLVVFGAIVAAIVFQQRAPSAPAHPSVAAAVNTGVAVPPPNALSASWYCAEGTSTPGGRADETVLLASLADARVVATITVTVGGSAPPVVRRIELAPHEEQRVHIADIVQTAEPGVVVEIDGGPAVVSHELVHGTDIAVEPCTRAAGTDWYFAAGSTVRGSQHYLALLNPFGDDAIVDVTLLTDSGLQQPDQLQAVVVPRRSRLTLTVHDQVPRQEHVATHVHARSGRVVVERTQIFDGTPPDAGPTREGIAVSLGAQAPAPSSYVAAGTTRGAGRAELGLGNFSASPTSVVVDVALAGDRTLEPQTVDVPAQGVVTVDITGRVPVDTDYAITVTPRRNGATIVPVVAELMAWWPPASTSSAVASTLGSVGIARRWVVTAPEGDADAYVTVLDPGAGPAVVGLLRAGRVDRGTSATSGEHRKIKAGGLAVFHVAHIGDEQSAFVVTADHAVVVGLTVLGAAGASASAAAPDPSYSG